MTSRQPLAMLFLVGCGLAPMMSPPEPSDPNATLVESLTDETSWTGEVSIATQAAKLPTDNEPPDRENDEIADDEVQDASLAVSLLHDCANERGLVKMGVDSGAAGIDVRHAKRVTIAQLATALAPATVSRELARWGAIEHQLFLLRNVQVTFTKRERDHDYHLALRDADGSTMVAEIVDPKCLVDATHARWLHYLEAARATVDRDLKVTKRGKTRKDVIATIAGVGFFDKIHGSSGGQKGHARNGVELHPVLAICFRHDCTFGSTRHSQ